MILYIAEKPSLGRAIADVLPRPHHKGDGFIRAGNGDTVSWCIGHLLEQAEPDAYDPAFKQWRLEHLPILPQQWQLTPKPKTRKQLTVLRKLVKEADQLVHAGDPDREGQLLVDEVIEYLGVRDAKRAAVQRCLISDLNPDAVRRALQCLRPNPEFVPLSTSALARSRADWLYGLNMTRAYTIQGRKVGYDGVLSVGRVQTPLLGLVVRRDQAIASFVPKPFYEVLAHLHTDAREAFHAKWQPSEACGPYQDEEGRVLSRPLAENVVRRISGQPGTVLEVDRKRRRQAAPLPYSLSSLQIDAAKRFGLSAKETLDTCQSLYEKHKLITYPRSDSRHLPLEHLARAPQVLGAIGHNCDALKDALAASDSARKSQAWNDSKVDAHHAIIPTEKKQGSAALQGRERQLYELIARQYVGQFLPDFEYFETRVEIDIAGGRFRTQARQVIVPGWKPFFRRQEPADDDAAQLLPALSVGQVLQCERGELVEKMTQPPKHFTDATLLAAMTGIARFVEDRSIRQILKDTDGLGTEATRAGIIELLFRRGFLERRGKAIHATPAGIGLINSLPRQTTLPDMTAQWEAKLEAICQRQGSYAEFMAALTSALGELIKTASNTLPQGLQGVRSATPGRGRKRGSGRTGRKAPAAGATPARKAPSKRRSPAKSAG
ncbi:DNA topoisomerase III [Marinobacterium rhizophilum]|uniref:DNA topoisomerase 3 n=1 Tax=Marinobacterium rhizophilum TaxID=420402 RepID=A0ABY5HM56_9GAMM|nr:DNA topoisomerase III [Marinobacterium rhizophilum]UTW13343.1 DNA topoisomerase III [Marinobacterium rhizophilum]